LVSNTLVDILHFDEDDKEEKMTKLFVAAVVCFVPTYALADYVCPADSDLCSYLVNTGETPPVGPGGGGHTADLAAWIRAPQGKVLANASVHTESQNGIHPGCQIEGNQGGQTRRINGFNIRVYSAYLVRAHAETGSGMGRVGQTAHMQCRFYAQVG
jgi:hypothetical protein